MKVASITDAAISHGLKVGVHSLCEPFGILECGGLTPLCLDVRVYAGSSSQGGAWRLNPKRRPGKSGVKPPHSKSLDLHLWHRRHARRQQMLRIDLTGLKDNLHRHPLHDFHVTSRSVLRWNQTETRAGAGLDTIDVRFKNFVRVSIDRDLDRFAGTDTSNLALFEIRGDPNVARNDSHQRRSEEHTSELQSRFG